LDISGLTVDKLAQIIEESTPSKELLEALKADERKSVKKLFDKYIRTKEAESRSKEKSEQLLVFERRLWNEGWTLVGGIDEAGRGPLAGPVVAACVVLPKGLIIAGVDDSKKLTPAKREALYDEIFEKAVSIGVGIVDNNRIDEVNILNATREAMQQAIERCNIRPDYLLIDAVRLDDHPIPQLSIIGGDRRSQSIAAASIIAKVIRDRLMNDYSAIYPGYGFEKHKGYGTAEHEAAIKRLGLSPLHRRSFTGRFA